MKVELPEFEGKALDAKSATLKLDWKTDKEGALYIVITTSAACDIPAGGTVKTERKREYDIHDSEPCDALRAFERIAKLLALPIDVQADLANEQKPLFGEQPSAN